MRHVLKGLTMQNLETIPLFRTALAPVLVEPPAAATETATIDADLTAYIGHTITAAEWAALQAECQCRHSGDWTFCADVVDEGYHIRRLTAR